VARELAVGPPWYIRPKPVLCERKESDKYVRMGVVVPKQYIVSKAFI